jgi:acetyl esterase/lipase/peroxiredoxin
MSRLFLFAGLLLPAPLTAADPPPARVTLPALRGEDGKAVNAFASRDTKAVVVAVLSFKCPVARDSVEPLSELARAYGPKGVTVIGVVPNESPEAVARAAAEHKAGFPVLADRNLAVVDALSAKHTPEVFLLDADRVVRYRGRVDDKFGERLKPNARITRNDLREALDELLAGKPVSVPRTDCVGCEIARPKEAAKQPARVTFYKDVLPILQNRCQECHRPGEAGPFDLMTYDDAVTWAADIKGYTQTRRMPPWKQTAGMTFQHDRRMRAAEIETLAAWVDGGTPEGDPKDAPPAKKFTVGWALGEPDLVLTPDAAFNLAARGPDHYRCFVIPTNLKEDTVLVGYEVRPGNPAVVHHVVNYFDTSGTARTLDQAARKKAGGADQGPGYESMMGIGFTPKNPEQVGGFGGWAPGMRGQRAPQGTGYLLPKGADVVFQVHYHRDGKPGKDHTRIGLYFAKGPDAKNLRRLKVLAAPGLLAESDRYTPFTAIPAGQPAFKVVGKVVLEEDSRLYAAMPHMHMLGSKVRITMTPPGGKEQVIVAVDEWDYGWQEVYRLVEPFDVKAGTVFTVEGVFDNSAANRLNPHSPPKDVMRGEGTTDEMLFGFLVFTSDSPGGVVKAHPLTDPADYDPRQSRHTRDVIYGRKHGLALTLDVFTPARPNGAAVIAVASAGWHSDREMIREAYYTDLLARGYTVFAVVHGSEPRFTVPEMVDDLHRAVRFVRHHARDQDIDPERLRIMGASAGGNLALLIATTGGPGDPMASDPVDRESSAVRAAAVFFPPTDHLNFGKPGNELLGRDAMLPKYKSVFDFVEFDEKKMFFVPVTDPKKVRDLTRRLSPAQQVTSTSAPTLFVHGDQDKLVPLQQSEWMVGKLEAAGVDVRLVVKKRNGHGWLTITQDMKSFCDWFDKHLPVQKRQ